MTRLYLCSDAAYQKDQEFDPMSNSMHLYLDALNLFGVII